MIKHFLLFGGLLFSIPVISQTGIGTPTPDPSARLEVAATNKGFLPPRVSLTATNSTSPITSPANGLMVFNTATAGTSPNQVVPGYYYWDATGLQWVSLSTTVGNVQNQGVFRSTSNTNGNTVVSSWNSRFNNIAAGDLTVTSNTSFALSNGIYKLEWALPYQQANTYNLMVLQEYRSSTWASFLSDNGYAAVGNGGNTDWGGGTFAADIVDCTSGTRTFRLFNLDGSRGLYYGASFIITKLNPSVTTSTTADNLGNHIADKNIQLNGNYLSNDGGNEGIRVDNSGNIGVGTATPGTTLHIENSNNFGSDPAVTTSPSLYIYNNNSASTTAHSTATIRTNGSGGGNPYLSFDINGVRGYSMGIDNADADKFKFHTNWSLNNANTPVLTITSDNRVGIGTTTPAVPLHVVSSVSQSVNGYGFLVSNSGGVSGYSAYNGSISYSIQADGRIRCPEFNAISDARIKRDINQLNTQKQLSELNMLKVVNYSYIDQLANGNKIKTGFIAQDLEKVSKQYVNQSTDFIPSVYAIAKSAVVNNKVIQITLEKSHDLNKGDEVKFFVEGKKEVIKIIDQVINPQSFTIKDWEESTSNLFVYGKKVTDFRAIDFDQITALSVAAIQELSKQIDILKGENANLKKSITEGIEARLLKLEAKMNQ